jgi:hypothetical protein
MPNGDNDDLAEFGNSIFSIGDTTPKKNKVKLRTILEGGSDEFSGKTPDYYRNKFNKILDKIVCKDSQGKWMTKTNNEEFLMNGDDGAGNSCSHLIVGKLLSSKDSNALNTHSKNLNKIIQQLDNLKKELLGDGGGGVPKQANHIIKSDLNLSNDQQILLNKIEKLQEFKKYGGIELNNISYTGKSKKILEMVYYISAIGIMGLFIMNQLKKGK